MTPETALINYKDHAREAYAWARLSRDYVECGLGTKAMALQAQDYARKHAELARAYAECYVYAKEGRIVPQQFYWVPYE